jgi:hypothetical protein
VRIKTILNQDFENLPQEEEKETKPKITFKKPLIIFASVFGAVLILLTATAIFMGFNPKGSPTNKAGQSTPTPTPEFKEEVTSPSSYATDSAILKNEEEIKLLDEKIQKTDLKESGLNPPVLEWKIEFEKN